jgi:hypothetical protein
MMADSTEAAVRARQPKSKQEIAEIVNQVIEGKRKTGQLDESGLTINDLNSIRQVFVEILQGMFHPRINYDEAVARVRRSSIPTRKPAKTMPAPVEASVAGVGQSESNVNNRSTAEFKKVEQPVAPKTNGIRTTQSGTTKRQSGDIPLPVNDDDNEPLPEVPKLRRQTDAKATDGAKAENEPTSKTTDVAKPDDNHLNQKEAGS